jgi:chromosome segregation ATPase
MRNFQLNLFILLALGLCGLCAWQWYDQARERQAIQTRNQMIYERDRAIQGYTNTISTTDKQIADLQQTISSLKSDATSNQDRIASQQRELTHLHATEHMLTNDVAQFQVAVSNLEGKLEEAYGGIKKQNDAIKQLVAQRDEFIQKYTNSINTQNDIVTKYNKLVERLNQLQSNNVAK